MKVVGVIPARYASIRFPAKVLANLAGKPLVQHVWEKALCCEHIDQVLIACDHPDVFKVAQGFGAQAVMTDANHASGSDRIAEAVRNLDAHIIVNIQGDEPFIDPKTIDSLVALLTNDDSTLMGTVIKGINDPADLRNPNVVKCVVDNQGFALYFSRSPLPYVRGDLSEVKHYKHLGLYAYRKDFLMQYTRWPKGNLEKAEQLEQLRVLEQGYKIKTVVTAYESLAVDTPEDLQKAEQFFKELKHSG